MENQKLYVSPSPHILSHNNTRLIMLGVTVALLPTLVASAFIFGWQVLLLTGVTVAACVGFEALWCVVRKNPVPVGDFSAVVTGLILAFNLPPRFPLWMATIGAFIAIVVVKQLFGGLGLNFANPALVGRMALQISFTGQMISYAAPLGSVDAVAGATPLIAAPGSYSLMDLLLGTHPGVLGETCALTLILGGLFLIAIKIISPIIPLIYIGGVFVLKLLLGMFGSDASFEVVSMQALSGIVQGGLLLGAFFMATDYVTSPYTRRGKVVFAIGLAVLTVAMREWSNMPEGVSYSILLMNLVVPYINGLTRQRPLGVFRANKAKNAGKEAAGNG